MKPLYLLAGLLLLLLPAQGEAADQNSVLSVEAALKADAAAFFGCKDATTGNLLAAEIPAGTDEAAVKRKIAGMLARFEAGPEEHVSVSLDERRVVISFQRIYKSSGSMVMTALVYQIDFDSHLSKTPIPSWSSGPWYGPESGPEHNKPNQALQHNDPSCHVSCLRTPRASRGRG